MIRRLILRAAGALLFITASCSDPASPGDNLEAARQRWSANGPASYQVTVFRSCFCPVETTGPVVVTVTNGAITSRVYAENGETVDASIAALYPDVSGLFGAIENAIERNADRMEIQYHPTLGYPIEIWIDFREATADEEIGYSASAFVAK